MLDRFTAASLHTFCLSSIFISLDDLGRLNILLSFFFFNKTIGRMPEKLKMNLKFNLNVQCQKMNLNVQGQQAKLIIECSIVLSFFLLSHRSRRFTGLEIRPGRVFVTGIPQGRDWRLVGGFRFWLDVVALLSPVSDSTGLSEVASVVHVLFWIGSVVLSDSTTMNLYCTHK